MSERMKILISYDGSECADAALEDLQRAGLPPEADAFVLSVADVFVPPPVNEGLDEGFPFQVPAGVKRAHAHAERELERARFLAARAGERVETILPGWRVEHGAATDSPAWAVINKADKWRPDLICVGAQGHTDLGGRLILGSVSQRVLYEARTSVRVARRPRRAADAPVRIVVGVDGSPDSATALDAVAARHWPVGSEARVLTVLGTMMSVAGEAQGSAFVKWVDADDEEDQAWARQYFEPWAERLRAAGLTATVEPRAGKPKHVLVEEAQDWEADAIFVGAKGVRGIDRLLLGSVAAAVAARAHCSVEVVRPQRTD